jgi:NAD(P)-dependent dehydrogenase (short-subunit alcohol dehydrogenase family)
MTETQTHGARVVIVTGSSSGFGRLTAQTLARQGYTVYATMRAVEDKNAAAAAALHELAAREDLALYALELDVADDASVERAVGQILATAGRIDVVVHNAAVGYVGPLEGFTLEQVRAQFETNVVGILRMNRAVLPPMRRQGAGLLVYVSSGAGRLVMPFLAPYVASKWALEALAEASRYELATFGIDAVIVQPGSYPTGAADKAVSPADTARLSAYGPALDTFNAAFGATLTAGQAGDPQEVADAIALLIARPAGQRPLRTVVAHVEMERQAPHAINDVTEQVQQGFLTAMGLESLVTLQAPAA